MADTIKTLSALQTLLADNTAGDISAQDVRDFLLSVYPRNAGYAEVPTTGWTWVNQTTSSEASVNGGVLAIKGAAKGSNVLTARVRTAPATPYTVIGLVGSSTSAPNGGAGLCFRESSTGKLSALYLKQNGQVLAAENWTDATTYSADITTGVGNFITNPFWLALTDNGTNVIYSIGSIGNLAGVRTYATASRTAFMSGGPDQIGWVVRDNNTAYATTLHSWEVS